MTAVIEPYLSKDAIRRILLSLIAAEQSILIKKNAIGPEIAIERYLSQATQSQIDDLTLDETSLGFDSLSRLDLVLRVNQFFNLHMSGVEDYLLVRRQIGDWVELVSQHFVMRQNDVSISFHTSGSTGKPKIIQHHLNTLRAEIDGLLSTKAIELPTDARVVALVPPHHIYGFLFSCLLPSFLGADTEDIHRQTPTSAFRKARPGDLLIATPYIWQRLASTGMEFPADVHGVTSAGPSNNMTWSALQYAGLTTLTEIYGATETGGIGLRAAFDQDFELLPHLMRNGEAIHHRQYVDEPLAVQDELNWSGQRTFRVLGRRDDIAQVAGVNVSPAYVARTIREVAGVQSAHVRLDKERLKAFVVPAAHAMDANTLEDRIRTYIADNLDPVARPAEIAFGTSTPRNEMGKLVDWD